MGKDFKGKELGEVIVQRANGTDRVRFVDKFGKRRQKKSRKLQEVRQWLADATYIDQHSDLDQATEIIVDARFDYSRANIPRFSMHVLSHTFATRCIEGGMKPKTLQKISGHSNIGITMNLYVHITEDEKHREIDLVADALKVV